MLDFQLIYILLNGIIYGLVLRRLKAVRSERGIFLFQTISFVILLCITAVFAFRHSAFNAAGLFVLSAISIHGIYSLSFLEVWSLSEGSYSISILRHLNSAKDPVSREQLEQLGAIGVQKDINRQAVLLKLGLIRKTGPDSVGATTFGYLLALFFRAVLVISNGTSMNR